jgi:hypothetical protein
MSNAPVISGSQQTIERDLTAAQGEGFPMSEPASAERQVSFPQGEGLPMGSGR